MNTAELKKLAEAATPGPWAQEEIDPTDPEWGACDVFKEESGDIVSSHVCSKENAAYIAAANPAAILKLLAINAELVEALKEISTDYADRFDLECPSTNPGIKSSIAQARTALAKAEEGFMHEVPLYAIPKDKP